MRESRCLPQTFHSPGHHSQAGAVILRASFEEELQSHTDPQERSRPIPQSADEPHVPEAGHGCTGGSHPGEHHPIGVFDLSGTGRQDRGCAYPLQTLSYGDQITGPVVHHGYGGQVVPLVDATPTRRESRATA